MTTAVTWRRWAGACIWATLSLFFFIAPATANIIVTSLADSGPGTLRQAILNANAAPGADTIVFNVATPGNGQIALQSALPVIAQPVTIDGRTQPGYDSDTGLPIIELNGAAAGASANGLVITSGNCNVYVLAINRFGGNGIRLQGHGGNLVAGCYIGVDRAATMDLGNTASGIAISGSSDNTLRANTIGGNNQHGVNLFSSATGNVLIGNFIGLSQAGGATRAIPNSGHGVLLTGVSGNTIGGATAGESNVIAHNGQDGVRLDGIDGVTSGANTLINNRIGTDNTGTSAQGNSGNGVTINGQSGNFIGLPGAGNVLSGNDGNGLALVGDGTVGNVVRANFIGLTTGGGNVQGNHGHGVALSGGAHGNTIGGNVPAKRNLIGGNGGDGVAVAGLGTTSNQIIGNFIGLLANGFVGSGNQGSGVSLNDAPGNAIGGVTASAGSGPGNVIAANNRGVLVTGANAINNLIQGNLIGLNAVGSGDLGNVTDGVQLIGGAGAGNGSRPGNVVDGNVIAGNDANGVLIGGGAKGNKVRGNFIGLDQNGAASVGNSADGVLISGAPSSTTGNTIGGTTAAQRNVIAGNGAHGVEIGGSGASNNTVAGNFIGTAPDGLASRANAQDGVLINGTTGNTIGGAGGAGNVISGNGSQGVEILGSSAAVNQVLGNRIGTTAPGDQALGNAQNGVFINGAPGNAVGSAGAPNTISGNLANGVEISGSGAASNTIVANRIGTTPNGALALSNAGAGVKISLGAPGNTVNGGNVIAFNGGDGALVAGTSSGNLIFGNAMRANGGLGINLESDGTPGVVTPNDPNDLDGGPNKLQNAPVITSLQGTDTGLEVSGTLNSTPSTGPFRIHFYGNTELDPSGSGEGETYLGSVLTTTNASGNAAFTASLVGDFAGQFITATASSPSDNTSEFSSAVAASALLSLDAASYQVDENIGSATVTVNRAGNLTQTVTVDYATANVTATAPADYAVTTGTLSFAPNETSQTIVVPIVDDVRDEPGETFRLTLSHPTGGAALATPASALVTITNDDPAPVVTVSNPATIEGDSGAKTLAFKLKLSVASGRTITVTYKTQDGTATAASDYTPPPSTSISFAPGQTTKSVLISITGDTMSEANETFNLLVQSATNATGAGNSGTGTIIDDDPLPALSIAAPAPVTELDTGSRNAVFTLALSAASGRPVVVGFKTVAGTATSGIDYAPKSDTVVFNPGQTTKSIQVAVLSDTLDEADETFKVLLSNVTGAALANTSATATIVDNDPPPTFSIGNATQGEGDSGTANFNFNIVLSVRSSKTVTVHYATANGTATAPADYTGKAGTLTFAPGETLKTVTVSVKGDTLEEPDESFFVNLSSPANATLKDGQGLGFIFNDDFSE